MKPKMIVALRFDLPEISHLEQDEQQRILTLCLDSAPVQEAWKLYWNRPQQISFIPLFIIVPICAFAHISIGVTLLIGLPVVFIGYYFVRRHYKRELVTVLRQTVAKYAEVSA